MLDAHDREAIAWRAVANAGISGSDVRDMLLETVEKRFGSYHAPEVIKVLYNNGSCYTAKETRVFARQLGLKSCFTPVASPRSNGKPEAFVKTLKRDYVRVHPLPNAEAVLNLIGEWIEDYNGIHPHSGLNGASLVSSSRPKPRQPRYAVKRGLVHYGSHGLRSNWGLRLRHSP